MLKKLAAPKRFSLLMNFIFIFIAISTLLRLSFLTWNVHEVDLSLKALLITLFTGLFYDIGTISFFAFIGALYMLLFPKKWYGSFADKFFIYTGFALNCLIIYFSFFAEVTFWEEFKRRFNFIAVDYLIYTYEVVKNINESYPLPLLIGGMLLLVALTFVLFFKKRVFQKTFHNETSFRQKLIPTVILLLICFLFTAFVKNENAEWSNNRYNNELSKAGIYSFFAAFRNNKLSYPDFYKTINTDKAFKTVQEQLATDSIVPIYNEKRSIRRYIKNEGIEEHPNVIFICVESLSADFLKTYGNKKGLTPALDSLANSSINFTNLFATGTRTVRGMEAITLSIPPTPGRSIVKRPDNKNLFTIGEVFKQKGYHNTFFYGGDGYFDNMDHYYSGNGFDIVDRGRGFLPSGDIVTKRTNIEDNEVTFENAWGVCDEDIYNKVLQQTDSYYQDGKPFFNFIMTTSNHRPYTYPNGKVDIPSGSGRNGAVQYTDFAIDNFIKQAKTRPWFSNTVFIIMADHCASSAGKWELDVANYHIPAMIINYHGSKPLTIDKQCSQIDIFPTLFDLLGWSYESNFYGKSVLKTATTQERAFVGNYRKLGLLKKDSIMILGDQKKANFYQWNKATNQLSPLPANEAFLDQTTSYYQTADYLYTHKKLTVTTTHD